MTLLKELITENSYDDEYKSELHLLGDKLDKKIVDSIDSGNKDVSDEYDKLTGSFSDLEIDNPARMDDEQHKKFIKGQQKIIKKYNL